VRPQRLVEIGCGAGSLLAALKASVRRAAWRAAPRAAERWFTVHYGCIAAAPRS
jgi:hypothetical protein